MDLPVSVWEPLQATLASFSLVDASELIPRLRQIKSPAEVKHMRRAAAASSRAMEPGSQR